MARLLRQPIPITTGYDDTGNTIDSGGWDNGKTGPVCRQHIRYPRCRIPGDTF